MQRFSCKSYWPRSRSIEEVVMLNRQPADAPRPVHGESERKWLLSARNYSLTAICPMDLAEVVASAHTSTFDKEGLSGELPVESRLIVVVHKKTESQP